jgi:hypothetical protein
MNLIQSVEGLEVKDQDPGRVKNFTFHTVFELKTATVTLGISSLPCEFWTCQSHHCLCQCLEINLYLSIAPISSVSLEYPNITLNAYKTE